MHVYKSSNSSVKSCLSYNAEEEKWQIVPSFSCPFLTMFLREGRDKLGRNGPEILILPFININKQ